MTTIEKSVDVQVPVRTAYNQWTQFESFPAFMEGVERVVQVNPTMTHWETRIGGVRREFDAQITEQHPDERIAWHTVAGPDQGGVVTFHRLDDHTTRVHLQMEYAPDTFVEKAGAALGIVGSRVDGDLHRFKEFIEHRGSETGGWRGDVPRPAQQTPSGQQMPQGQPGQSAAEGGFDPYAPGPDFPPSDPSVTPPGPTGITPDRPGYGTPASQPGYGPSGQPRHATPPQPGTMSEPGTMSGPGYGAGQAGYGAPSQPGGGAQAQPGYGDPTPAYGMPQQPGSGQTGPRTPPQQGQSGYGTPGDPRAGGATSGMPGPADGNPPRSYPEPEPGGDHEGPSYPGQQYP